MNQSQYAFMVVVGLLLAAYGTGMLLRGRNYPPPLGRGLTRGDTQRMERAPGAYFRALGAMVAAGGLALLNYGVLARFGSSLPGAVATSLQVVEALLELAVLVSAFWVWRLASRYKLFRWNKP